MSKTGKSRQHNTRYFWAIGCLIPLCHASHALAQPISTAPECHIDIQQLPPDPDTTHILKSVNFKYHVTYDESCHLHVIPKANSPMECDEPLINIKPAQLLTQFTAEISVQCHFKRPGYFFSPPVEFEISQENIQTRQIHTPNLHLIHIQPYISTDAGTKPIEAELQLSTWKQTGGYAWLIFALLILGTLAITFGYAKYSRKKQPTIEQLPPPLSPYQIFLSEIDALLPITPETVQEYKSYHDRLSNSLRQYLTAKTNFDAMSCTTKQIDENLTSFNLPNNLKTEIIRLLKQSDIIKFTRDVPSLAANLTLLRDTCLLAENLEHWFLEKEKLQTEQENPTQTQSSP